MAKRPRGSKAHNKALETCNSNLNVHEYDHADQSPRTFCTSFCENKASTKQCTATDASNSAATEDDAIPSKL